MVAVALDQADVMLAVVEQRDNALALAAELRAQIQGLKLALRMAALRERVDELEASLEGVLATIDPKQSAPAEHQWAVERARQVLHVKRGDR